jgi:Ca-activated chloride channel family protein
MHFRFEQSWFLLLLFVLPLIWFCQRRMKSPSLQFGPARVFRAGLKSAGLKRVFIQRTLFYSAILSLIFGLARPQFGTTSSQIHASGIDVVLLLDVSRSMLSEDFTIGGERASRIDVVKQVTERFIEGRPNDRIGVIAFAGRPFLVSPLTLDHTWLLANLSRLQIGLTEDGTAIGSALVSAANRLRDRKAKSRVIVLLTDGDNNAGSVPPYTAAEAAAAVGIKIYTIGTGTNGLVPFPETDRFGNKFYTEEYMPFQEDTCRRIAEIGHGQFFRATDTRGMEAIFSAINRLEKTEMDVRQTQHYRDYFSWLVGAGVFLLGVSTILGETIWRSAP